MYFTVKWTGLPKDRGWLLCQRGSEHDSEAHGLRTVWTSVPSTEAGKAGEWAAALERKINRSIVDASGLRCPSDIQGEMSSAGSGLQARGQGCGSGVGVHRRVRNPAQIEMELISWRASAIHQALDFKSRVRHLIAPALRGSCYFPSDSEFASASTAVCSHSCPSSAAFCLRDLEQVSSPLGVFRFLIGRPGMITQPL